MSDTRSRTVMSLLGRACTVLSLFVLLAACSGTSTTTTSTPTPISSSTNQYTIIPLNLPAAAYNAPTIGPLSKDSEMNLGVSFKVNNSAIPPNKGQFKKGQVVDGAKIANAYGISDATYAKIKAYLGIADVQLSLGGLHSYMAVKAKASSIEQLFQTQFIVHQLDGRKYYVPDANKPPKLPSAIMGYVIAVTGLESYFTLKPGYAHLATPFPRTSSLSAQDGCNPPNTNVHQLSGYPVDYPNDVATSYGLKSFYNAGETGDGLTVNLAEVGGYYDSALANYFACVNFPQSHFNAVDTIPPASKPDPDGTGEAMLDIEMVAGLVPGANIIDYQAASAAPNPNASGEQVLFSTYELLNGTLQRIINDNAQGYNGVEVTSVSYGTYEGYMDPNVINALDASISSMVNVEGITTFVSSGDCGAFGPEVLNKLGVEFPSTDPSAVAVGGTELYTNAQGQRTREVVWNTTHPTSPCNNSWGGGGGVSQVFKRPNWQTGRGVTNRYSTGARQTPDVAAASIWLPIFTENADDNNQDEWVPSGGTSAAAPIWAASFGLADIYLAAKTGSFFAGPEIFYQVAAAGGANHPYFDITQGNNLYYAATPGWDNATGWGSPNLPGFYNTMFSLLKK